MCQNLSNNIIIMLASLETTRKLHANSAHVQELPTSDVFHSRNVKLKGKPQGKPRHPWPISGSHGNILGVRIYFGIFVRFSSGPAKCRILQHFLAKLTHFTLARQHPQHRFQHPPHVRPTSLASPTDRG